MDPTAYFASKHVLDVLPAEAESSWQLFTRDDCRWLITNYRRDTEAAIVWPAVHARTSELLPIRLTAAAIHGQFDKNLLNRGILVIDAQTDARFDAAYRRETRRLRGNAMRLSDLTDKLKQFMGSAQSKAADARERGGSFADQARDMKGDLTEKAKSGMDSAKAKMDEMKSDATSAADSTRTKMDDARSQANSAIDNAQAKADSAKADADAAARDMKTQADEAAANAKSQVNEATN